LTPNSQAAVTINTRVAASRPISVAAIRRPNAVASNIASGNMKPSG